MEDNKIIISCSKCGKQIRIPADKHIRFSCPNCGHEQEYKNGQKVIKEKRRRGPLILFIVIAVAGIFFWLISRNSNNTYQQTDVFTPYDTTVKPPENPVSPETPPFQPYTVKKDTAEELLSDLQKDILEEALDVLKDIVEELLEEINEEAENGDWEKANKWFEEATETMKNGRKKGETLIKIFEKDLAKTKNNILRRNPAPNILPDSRPIDASEEENTHATEEVKNSTNYILTLYYTGPTNTVITIPPGGETSVSLLRGSYSVVAKVSAPLVSEYYGPRIYGGYSYATEYYIRMKYY